MRDGPELDPPAGHVRVAVHAAGVCGSDVLGFSGANDRRPPGIVMGHEVSGRIDRVGEGVPTELIGTPVAMNPMIACGACPACTKGRENRCPRRRLIGCTLELAGGFAEQVVMPVRSAVPWNPALPLHWGAFVEPFAVGMHAVDLAQPAGRAVWVIGSGAVGLSVAIAADDAGAASVTVVALTDDRRRLFEKIGLTVTGPDIAPAARADVVIDCVASTASFAAALDVSADGGTIVVVGLASPEVTVPVVPLVHGERVLRGSSQYPAATFVRAARRLGLGTVPLDELLSELHPLEAAPALFRQLVDGAGTSTRTLMSPETKEER